MTLSKLERLIFDSRLSLRESSACLLKSSLQAPKGWTLAKISQPLRERCVEYHYFYRAKCDSAGRVLKNLQRQHSAMLVLVRIMAIVVVVVRVRV